MKLKNVLPHSFLFYQNFMANGQKTNDVCLVKQYYTIELAPLSKTYKKGDSGSEVLKIKEWLMLRQLNQH